MSEQANPLNVYLTISVSDDKLKAFLCFTNFDNQFKVTREQMDAFLKENGIVFGVDEALIDKIVANPRAYSSSSTLIATGQSPINGTNGSLKDVFELDVQSKKPTELEGGKVDYKEITTIHNVRKGQLISECIPATPGIHGKAVTGEIIHAKDGKEAHFKMGKNVVSDAEQRKLYAAIDGMVTRTERDKINVFPVFEVNGDVDYNVGNIDFVGNVVIRGNVLTGFRIRSEGDIRVTGSVDGAEVEAGGSIEITAGILGGNKGIVRAGKSVKCSFIQDAVVEAGEEVIASQCMMHSQIRAGKSVICKGTKGLIVGGIVQAGEKVIARTIGNTLSTATVIEVGVLPELRNEHQQLRQQTKMLHETLEKSEKALALLDQMAAAGQLTPERVAMRIKLNHSKKQTSEELISAKERLLEIEKSLEDSTRARVEVIGNAYAGTKIVIGRYTKFVKDTTPRSRFQIIDGEVSFLPLL